MEIPSPSFADALPDLPGRRPLAGAPRAIRHLEPPEAPWPGVLAAQDDRSCFLVDAQLLIGWAGWDAAPDSHVLAPSDVVRRVDGHDVLLALCTERLARFLQRRAGRGVHLSAGEAVTVVVSVLRGTADVLARHPLACGEWWLTDTGKPVFVHGEGPDAILAADLCLAGLGSALPDVADLRARLGSSGATGTASGAPGADLAHPRALAAALPEIERALFARSAPEALATTDLAPARARAVDAAAAEADDVLAHAGRRRWPGLARLVDSDLREVVAVGWDALRESRRRRARARQGQPANRARGRRIAVAAGAAAAVAVGIAVLWPSGGSVGAHGATPSAEPTRAVAVGAEKSSPRTSSGASASAPASRSDPGSSIRAMLVLRAACTDDACRDGFLEEPGHRLPAGAVDDAAASVTLLDEYGGAAVVRMTSASTSGSGRSQLVIVVKSNEKWLVRDVTDAADQP